MATASGSTSLYFMYTRPLIHLDANPMEESLLLQLSSGISDSFDPEDVILRRLREKEILVTAASSRDFSHHNTINRWTRLLFRSQTRSPF